MKKYTRYSEPSITNGVRTRRIDWLGHLERMLKERVYKKIMGRERGRYKKNDRVLYTQARDRDPSHVRLPQAHISKIPSKLQI